MRFSSAQGGLYSVQLAFGDPSVQLGGLERRADGLWLLTPAKPEEGGGPRDIVLFGGVSPAPYFNDAAGIPEYARIDAVMLDAGGALVLSFDVPVNLGRVEFGPSDMVRFDSGGFSLFWDSAVGSRTATTCIAATPEARCATAAQGTPTPARTSSDWLTDGAPRHCAHEGARR